MPDIYIDELNVPMAAGGVIIACPLGTDPVPVTFHALVDFGSPDADVSFCKLKPASGTSRRITSRPPPGSEVAFEFATVTPGTYTISAKGTVTAEQNVSGIVVATDALLDCPSVSMTPPGSGDPSLLKLKSLIFTGKPRISRDGNVMPIRIIGMVPATFTFGGKAPENEKMPEITLVPDEGKEKAATIKVESIKSKGAGWAQRFSNVPAGNYTLKVGSDPKPLDSCRIMIRTK